MLGATTTALGSSTGSPTEQPPTLLPSTRYLCNSCQITFGNGQEQRRHMKEPWHVYNLKRRTASLHPITSDAYGAEVKKSLESKDNDLDTKENTAHPDSTGNEIDVDISDEESPSPFQCMFCNEFFSINDSGLAANIEHMHSTHGFEIPDAEDVIDMESFLGYLATEVREWHECLYCGATKPSTKSIQSHMRDKGHCLLNLDREPELLDFWESPILGGDEISREGHEPANIPVHLSATEMRFASGKIIGSRHSGLAASRPSTRRHATQNTALTAFTQQAEEMDPAALLVAPQPSSSRKLARRDEASIMGITTYQRQALMLAEKKAQRSEAMAHRAREWVNARSANFQQHDQVDTGKTKWGKKNHKLLPR